MTTTRKSVTRRVLDYRGRHVRNYYKIARNYTFGKKVSEGKTLLIFGCQRSGTTLMTKIMESNADILVFPEKSKFSSKGSEKLRLNPQQEVISLLRRVRMPVTVLKPLVESQRADEWLSALPNSYGYWMFRHYRDVARSNLKRFGDKNGVRNLRYLLNDNTNWRGENVSEETYQIVKTHFSDDMSENDAAALFWFARNQLFFERNLQSHPRMLMCKYEELTIAPEKVLGRLFDYLDYHDIDKKTIASMISTVHATSIGKGNDLQLSPSLEKLCDDMLAKLEHAFANQSESVENSVINV